jgi:hypothetical protein
MKSNKNRTIRDRKKDTRERERHSERKTEREVDKDLGELVDASGVEHVSQELKIFAHFEANFEAQNVNK